MPPLSEQHRLLEQTFTAYHVVVRLLTPLGLAYEKAVERYAPYDRIIAPQPRMRQDTTALVQQVVAQGKSAYVLVNNRAEGCSPLTVQALVAGCSRMWENHLGIAEPRWPAGQRIDVGGRHTVDLLAFVTAYFGAT
jgi:hypothetical protein